MKKYDLVCVLWEDSAQPVRSWVFTSDLATEIEMTPVICRTVGWVVYEGDGVIALAQSMGEEGKDNEQAMGITRIPVRCIVKRKKLNA